MSKHLMIAVFCVVALLALFAEVGANQCKFHCRRNCHKQHNKRGRELANCNYKCVKTAKKCSVCSSPRTCSKCQPGYQLQNRQCVGNGQPGGPAEVKCLKDIDVFYTFSSLHNAPYDFMINEAKGGSSDINEDIDADYVWLVPSWQSSKTNAISSIGIIITDEKMPLSDIARGDGNEYRYMNLMAGDGSAPCISDITLWRASSPDDTPDKAGWEGYSNDINDGSRQSAGILYLAWMLD